jgi:tetratricopeptide (TPR) repeat protein/TolB-like protein
VDGNDCIDLGGARVDVGNGRIEGDGGEIALEPRVLDLVVELDRQRGEVVARDALIERIWENYPGADQSLTTSVSKLRRAIRDAGGDARILRTFPKRGYCLDPAAGAPAGSGGTRRVAWLALSAGLLVLALPVMLLLGSNAGPPRVAVLPLATVGDAPEPGLARGVGQEISTRLAALGGVELVYGGRASLPVDGGDELAEIADALDADYLLTGSFRRGSVDADGRRGYRIAAQLIRAGDRSSIWGEVFRAPAGALFDLEVEIATAVARALPGVDAAVGQDAEPAPTEDERAYRNYLRAIGLSRRSLPTADQVADAYFALRRAVERDPSFAQAWAELSIVLGQQERWQLPEPEVTAEEALRRAVELAPGAPDVRIAQAMFRVRRGRSPASAGRAMQALLAVLEQRPNSTRALSALAQALRQAGRFRLAVDVAEAALRRAPEDPEVITTAAMAHAGVRQWRRAERLRTRLSDLEPEQYVHWEGRARMRLRASGSVAEARAILGQAPDGLIPPKVHAEYDLYERDLAAVIARAEARIERDGLEAFVVGYPVLSIYAGFAYRQVGEDERADAIGRNALRSSRAMLDAHPDNPILLDNLARALQIAGRDDEAVAAACRAARIRSGHASARWGRIEALAQIAAMTGRTESALALIERLLAADYGTTPLNRHALRIQPMWDSLRELPRFRALVERAPVARFWRGERVPVARLLERVRDIASAPPVELPAIGPPCGDAGAGTNESKIAPDARRSAA